MLAFAYPVVFLVPLGLVGLVCYLAHLMTHEVEPPREDSGAAS